jgi:hypothetical protein
MQKVRTIAISALWFLSISAMVGAIPLLLDPTGRPWGYMTLDMLQHSPVHAFLIPGVILFLANGVMSLFVLDAMRHYRRGYGWWVAFQGCVLAGWIVVEIILLCVAAWPQILYLAVGVVLITTGLAMTRRSRAA